MTQSQEMQIAYWRERVRVLTDERDKAIEAGAAMLDVAGRKEMKLRVLTEAARAVFDAGDQGFDAVSDEFFEALVALRGVLDDHPRAESRELIAFRRDEWNEWMDDMSDRVLVPDEVPVRGESV